jgi:hypothetical protein
VGTQTASARLLCGFLRRDQLASSRFFYVFHRLGRRAHSIWLELLPEKLAVAPFTEPVATTLPLTLWFPLKLFPPLS